MDSGVGLVIEHIDWMWKTYGYGQRVQLGNALLVNPSSFVICPDERGQRIYFFDSGERFGYGFTSIIWNATIDNLDSWRGILNAIGQFLPDTVADPRSNSDFYFNSKYLTATNQGSTDSPQYWYYTLSGVRLPLRTEDLQGLSVENKGSNVHSSLFYQKDGVWERDIQGPGKDSPYHVKVDEKDVPPDVIKIADLLDCTMYLSPSRVSCVMLQDDQLSEISGKGVSYLSAHIDPELVRSLVQGQIEVDYGRKKLVFPRESIAMVSKVSSYDPPNQEPDHLLFFNKFSGRQSPFIGLNEGQYERVYSLLR